MPQGPLIGWVRACPAEDVSFSIFGASFVPACASKPVGSAKAARVQCLLLFP